MKIAFLSPSFFMYRVPVFERMADILGQDFIVIVNSYQTTKRGKEALKFGSFPKKILKGRQFMISKKHDKGEETPFGFTLTPGLPIELLRFNPDVVISINFSTWTLTSILLGFRTVIFWEGTFFTERTVKKWRLLLRKWMVKRAKGFVVNGKLSREYLEWLGANREIIIEGGLCPLDPPRDFVNYKKQIKNNNELIFLFIGQLIPRKGVIHLLEAFSIMQKEISYNVNSRLIIVGDGPDKLILKNIVKEKNLSNKVNFIGDISYEEIWNYYASADVFILPTLQDNWPLVVPEAMKMGLPILLSKYAGSVPDLIQEGKNGHVFDPFNHRELAMLMINYIENPQLILEHGRISQKIVEKYNPKNVADIFLKAAEAALNS